MSILANLQDTSSSTYSNSVTLAVWRAITNSDQKPPNAFSSFLQHLAQSASEEPGGSNSLCPCNHWLAAQLGIALLKMYAAARQWQSGFVVLHHLQRCGINLFADQTPVAPLPPLKPPHPSSFDLVRLAVTTCLKMDSTDSAVQALRESEWAREYTPREGREREMLLMAVAQKCFDSGLYEDCCGCLQALGDLTTSGENFANVANLFNQLLASVLDRDSANVDLGSHVYQTMSSNSIPCLPTNFTLLLEKLCELLQFSTAQELCEQAIDQSFYSPITRGCETFAVFLPPSIHHVEVRCLVKRHLHQLSGELEGKVLPPLIINFEGQSLSLTLPPSLPLPPSPNSHLHTCSVLWFMTV